MRDHNETTIQRTWQAMLVGHVLGRGGDEATYQDAHMTILANGYRVRVELADGTLVFAATLLRDWGVEAYREGRWEKELERLARESFRVRAEKREQERAEREARERENFEPVNDAALFVGGRGGERE